MDRFFPIVDNEWYHVYNRGNDRQTLFHTSADYDAFVKKLEHSLSRYMVSKIAFVLMPNHFHLVLVQLPGGDLPHFMNSIESSYAMRYNLRYHHKGHVFGGRYHYLHVPSEASLLDLVCYVHMNPVRAKLVTKPEDWKYSDLMEVMKNGIQPGSVASESGHALVSPDCYREQIKEAMSTVAQRSPSLRIGVS